jgi:hypothetical protein
MVLAPLRHGPRLTSLCGPDSGGPDSGGQLTLVDSIWVIPAGVVAIGSTVVALMAARVARRADSLRTSLVEVPSVRDSLRAVRDELQHVRLTVEDLHRR